MKQIKKHKKLVILILVCFILDIIALSIAFYNWSNDTTSEAIESLQNNDKLNQPVEFRLSLDDLSISDRIMYKYINGDRYTEYLVADEYSDLDIEILAYKDYEISILITAPDSADMVDKSIDLICITAEDVGVSNDDILDIETKFMQLGDFGQYTDKKDNYTLKYFKQTKHGYSESGEGIDKDIYEDNKVSFILNISTKD